MSKARITQLGNTRHFRTPTGKSRMLHNETDKAPKTWTFIGYFAVNEETGKLGYYNPKYGNFDDRRVS